MKNRRWGCESRVVPRFWSCNDAIVNGVSKGYDLRARQLGRHSCWENDINRMQSADLMNMHLRSSNSNATCFLLGWLGDLAVKGQK